VIRYFGNASLGAGLHLRLSTTHPMTTGEGRPGLWEVASTLRRKVLMSTIIGHSKVLLELMPGAWFPYAGWIG